MANLVVSILIIIEALTIAYANFPSIRKCQKDQFECDNGNCISKSYWCRGYRHCRDGSDQRSCGLYPRCAQHQVACTPESRCIPQKWECDGYVDCRDGSDETDCFGGRKMNITASRINGRSWLLKQRRGSYGWEGQSHRAITALYLSNTSQFYPGDYESKLMRMQLQLHLSEVLLRDKKQIPTHDKALYIHSLLSTCINPRRFQYHDFVRELQQLLEESSSFNPFFALVLCNANATLSSESISKLVEITKQPHEPEWIEQQAFALMTISCIQNHPQKSLEVLNETIYFNKDDISNITWNLKSLQRNDGSFGSLHTTALVMQALQAAGDSGDGWNSKKALFYLISKQQSDGSFDNDILSTYLVLPILNKKSLFNLGNVFCIDSSNLTAKDELDSKNTKPQKITYTIIVGLHKDITFSITFTVPANTTFFDAMRLAEELDARYRFSYTPYPSGNYVHTLFGIKNDPEAGLYWQLYQIKRKVPSLVEKGPDRLIIENNGKYIHWYRPTSRVIGSQTEAKESYMHDILSEP